MIMPELFNLLTIFANAPNASDVPCSAANSSNPSIASTNKFNLNNERLEYAEAKLVSEKKKKIRRKRVI